MKGTLTFLASMLLALAVFTLCTKQRNPSDFAPGQEVPGASIERLGLDAFFYSQLIGEDLFARMDGKSYKKDCPVPLDSLRYIRVLIKNLQGKTLVGEMVVGLEIEQDVLYILKELYKASYPIERMVLVDEYDAQDELSMRANNSSSFNFRFISGTTVVSNHGKGIAVDINPLYNPYFKVTPDGPSSIEPSTGAPYTDRTLSFPYKIEEDDLCCRLFKSRGFEWGGDWTTVKDYQHFEKCYSPS